MSYFGPFWGAIAQVAQVAGTAVSIAGAAGAFTPDTPEMELLTPPVVDTEKIKEDEKKKLRQGLLARKTLKTGSQGLLEPATVEKKVLLGE